MKQKRINLVLGFTKILAILVIVFFFGFAVVSTYRLNISVDEGNREYVSNYTYEVANRLHSEFEMIDTGLKPLRLEIEEVNSFDLEELTNKLQLHKEVWDLDACGILYHDGTNILSDGTEVVFENEIKLYDVLTYAEQLNVTQQKILDEDVLLFVKPCTSTEIRGVFAAIKIKSIEDILSDYSYTEYSFFALTQNDGNTIWKQGEISQESGKNCFTELEKLKINLSDSVSQARHRMNANKDGTICYTKDGSDYYMAYVPLQINQWYLLVSTNADTINLIILSRDYFLVAILLMGIIVLMGVTASIYFIRKNRYIVKYNKQLIDTTALANQANDAKRDFLAKISHEIRTPLNGVMGMIALAKANFKDKEKCHDYLDKATTSASYLLELLNDVLDMSRIESGKQQLINATIDLNKMKSEVFDILETSSKDKNLSISIDDSNLHHHYYRGDYTRVKQIIINLISNSIKYTPIGGKVSLELEDMQNHEEGFIIRVKDTGEGIPESKLTTIFEPFEQVDITRHTGVGLGLSIVKKFVELMAGRIEVQSEVGVGSTFTIYLPLEKVESIENEKETLNFEDLNGIKVLLAEDNMINAEIIIELLKLYNVDVSLALDGVEAVEEFTKNPIGTFDIILLDIQMPNKDGIEAAKEIRAFDRSDALDIPIIALTANAFENQKIQMKNAGMNDALFKPIDIEKVCLCILKWLKK